MSQLENIEQAIATRLAPLRELGIFVRGLPNKTNETGVINGAGVVTIAWAQDEIGAPIASGAFQQAVQMRWVLEIRIKNLKTEAGIGALRQGIYGLLLGFQPPHCGKMYAQSFEFVDRQESVWVFEARFICPSVLFEQTQEDAIALLQQIVYQPEVNGDVVPEHEYLIVPEPA